MCWRGSAPAAAAVPAAAAATASAAADSGGGGGGTAAAPTHADGPLCAGVLPRVPRGRRPARPATVGAGDCGAEGPARSATREVSAKSVASKPPTTSPVAKRYRTSIGPHGCQDNYDLRASFRTVELYSRIR